MRLPIDLQLPIGGPVDDVEIQAAVVQPNKVAALCVDFRE